MDAVSHGAISIVTKYEGRLFSVHKLMHSYTHTHTHIQYTVSRTYMAVVDETVFPGDAVSLLWPPIDLDSPGVGVDLCSISPLQFCSQEDKDCPYVQQGHPGIHEKENTSQGSLSVCLSLLRRQSGAALPYSSKVEQWPRDERTEPAINTNMAFLTGSLLGLNYLLQIAFRKQNCSKNKQHTHRPYHASYLAHCQLSNAEREKKKKTSS